MDVYCYFIQTKSSIVMKISSKLPQNYIGYIKFNHIQNAKNFHLVFKKMSPYKTIQECLKTCDEISGIVKDENLLFIRHKTLGPMIETLNPFLK